MFCLLITVSLKDNEPWDRKNRFVYLLVNDEKMNNEKTEWHMQDMFSKIHSSLHQLIVWVSPFFYVIL